MMTDKMKTHRAESEGQNADQSQDQAYGNQGVRRQNRVKDGCAVYRDSAIEVGQRQAGSATGNQSEEDNLAETE